MDNSKELSKHFWRFLWSSILIALSGCLGNIVDAIIVGNMIGADGVSAINLTKPVVQFMFTLSMLLSAGAGMLVGMEIGKKDSARAAYIYTLSLLSTFFVGLALTVCGLLIPDTITGWLCSNEQLFRPTYEYLIVVLLGAPAYMVLWTFSNMVGVDGSPRLVSLAILIDNAVNLMLDIVFIQYFGWGIEGSSSATVIGHLVGIAFLSRHFFYKENNLRLRFQCIGLKLKTAMAQIISQGAPLAIASVCLTLLLMCANTIVLDTTGRVGIFVFALCLNLLQIYNLFLAGVCRTIQSLGSIEVGKGSNHGLREVIGKGFKFISIAMIITCVLVWIYPQGIAELFGGDDPAMMSESKHALRVFSLSFIPFCYIYVLMIVYKLYSYHKMALFISFALSLTVIPVLWVVAKVAPQAIWYSYLIAYVIECIAIYIIHKATGINFGLRKNAPAY